MALNLDLKLVDEATILDREAVERVPNRDGFGEGLVLAADADENVVALCADLTVSVRMDGFRDKYPDRFFEIGAAEQNLAVIASGLSAVGKVPFFASYAMFSPGRNWEQIRTTLAYNQRGAIIVGSHAGISVGPDGATHQAVEDMAIMRVIPNMTVLAPTDTHEARRATLAAAKYAVERSLPVYIRLARDKTPVITTPETPFEIGKAYVFRDGSDVALVAQGPMVYEALLAAAELENEGISARVINNPSIKPLDHETLTAAAKECGAMVTAEEHQMIGGMGSAIAELLVHEHPVPMEFVGVNDRFGESGQPEELMDVFGLRASDIVEAAKRAVGRKA